MNKNIELKAYCLNLEGIRKASLALGAKLIRNIKQSDTFYCVSNGKLKLRQNNSNDAFLIFYIRSDSPTVRESSFDILPIFSEPEHLNNLLSKALDVRITVHKHRETYSIGPTLINIDSIEDIGNFVEIEVDEKLSGSAEKAFEIAQHYMDLFNISKADIIPYSYADLLIMNKSSIHWRDQLQRHTKTGKVFLLDGASCSGKTTLAHHLVNDEDLNLNFAARYCTRKPRENESSESEYIFVSRQEFSELAASGAFFDYRDFEFDMSYGLAWKQTISPVLEGKNVLGIINLGNIVHVKKYFPEAITILIDAPEETIKRRLICRGVNKKDQIEERLGNARSVRLYKNFYDYIVDNDDNMLQNAELLIKNIIKQITYHAI